MERSDDDENPSQELSKRSSMQISNHSTKGSSISSKRSSTTSSVLSEKEEGNKYCRWLLNTVKICLAIWFVYVFIFAIGLLSDSFQVLGGAFLNDIIVAAGEYLENPFCGLCMGILLTVLCQSSSTATSIFITLVGSRLFEVSVGIYCIYGANVGTSITSTLVAFGNVANPTEFRSGMACAAIPAIYAYLIILFLFPLEILFQMMESLTELATQKYAACVGDDCQIEDGGFDPIAVITEPIQQYILVIDKDGLGQENYNGTFVQYCKNSHTGNYLGNGTCLYPDEQNCPPNKDGTYMTQGNSYDCTFNEFDVNETFIVKFEEACYELEKHMFVNSCMSDVAIGGICFALSFVLMYGSLVGVVSCLKSVLAGPIQQILKDNIDKNLPYPVGWLTDYLYVLFGIILTIAVQSSSIVLSILTPIVAIGVVSIDRAYPITIGAHIGTTITGLIAAFSNSSGAFRKALQVALSHVFFNVFGFTLFFLIPITRRPVVKGSNWIGKMAGRYRWWSIMYTILAFILLPILLFVISIFPKNYVDDNGDIVTGNGHITSLIIMYTIAFGFTFVATITWFQQKYSGCLPSWWKDWKFLPIYCRSLEPIDSALCSCTKKPDEKDEISEKDATSVENEAYADYETSAKTSKRESCKAEADDYEFSTDF